MDATCSIQDSIHVFSLVHKYVSRILGTYHFTHLLLIYMMPGIKDILPPNIISISTIRKADIHPLDDQISNSLHALRNNSADDYR